jgi:hypothetical protein
MIGDFMSIINDIKNSLPTSILTFGGVEDGLSIQGASHIRHNKICQDFGGHYRNDDYAVAVVCDGHGSDPYFRSDRGSKFAVEAALDVIKEFMDYKQDLLKNAASSNNADVQKKSFLKAIDQLNQSIILQWNNKVSADMQANPFTEEELAGLSDKYKERYSREEENEKFMAYGTTLIAVVRVPEFWFGIRNGDGKCVAIGEDGSFCDPIPWNDKCFMTTTTSLCDDRAFENFRSCFYTDNFPVAIYVGTDGVDDSFGSDERLFSFYKLLTEIFVKEGFEEGKKQLADYIPKLSAQGSGDDISISGIIDMEKINGLLFEKKAATEELVENKEDGNTETGEEPVTV